MSRKKTTSDDSGPCVPAYIVTFSDMITLLLTFFVLLLSLADEQKEELFTAGQSAFKRALADFGMSGSLFSSHNGLDFEHPKAKYRVNEGQDENNDRSIDSQMEMLRRKLLDVERTMEILPSQIVGVSKTFTVTNIRFKRGKWNLDEPTRVFLNTYCRQLAETLGTEAATVYVVGLAATERTETKQWLVSAHRAEAVADFIKTSLGEQSNKSVYFWGAGSGGQWSGTSGVISKQTNIMIVTLTSSK